MIDSKPPQYLDGAKVLKYVHINSEVPFTGKSNLYFINPDLPKNDPNYSTKIGRVPNLAICQNEGDSDYLLFYCNKDWGVLFAAGCESVESAIKKAAVDYVGIENNWYTLI